MTKATDSDFSASTVHINKPGCHQRPHLAVFPVSTLRLVARTRIAEGTQQPPPNKFDGLLGWTERVNATSFEVAWNRRHRLEWRRNPESAPSMVEAILLFECALIEGRPQMRIVRCVGKVSPWGRRYWLSRRPRLWPFPLPRPLMLVRAMITDPGAIRTRALIPDRQTALRTGRATSMPRLEW
jgi:hypothetical protein